MSVVQENWPLELVPKIGVGMMRLYVNKMRPIYHTGKNGVKAGETLGSLRVNVVNTPCPVGIFHAVLMPA
ncbi:MAG: hypothetical protein SGJ16_02620 [Nitrospirota bacterium]|nr:hypothetical protein [Nitrospirota bacterium]